MIDASPSDPNTNPKLHPGPHLNPLLSCSPPPDPQLRTFSYPLSAPPFTFLLTFPLQVQTLTLTATCHWRRREVYPSHLQRARTMAGLEGVSNVHSAGQPRVRDSLPTPKVIGAD